MAAACSQLQSMFFSVHIQQSRYNCFTNNKNNPTWEHSIKIRITALKCSPLCETGFAGIYQRDIRRRIWEVHVSNVDQGWIWWRCCYILLDFPMSSFSPNLTLTLRVLAYSYITYYAKFSSIKWEANKSAYRKLFLFHLFYSCLFVCLLLFLCFVLPVFCFFSLCVFINLFIKLYICYLRSFVLFLSIFYIFRFMYFLRPFFL